MGVVQLVPVDVVAQMDEPGCAATTWFANRSRIPRLSSSAARHDQAWSYFGAGLQSVLANESAGWSSTAFSATPLCP